VSACDHNVIPIRVRFRDRWICVRCDRVFSTPPPRHVLMDAETFAWLLSEEPR
jgi:hypothetical protein